MKKADFQSNDPTNHNKSPLYAVLGRNSYSSFHKERTLLCFTGSKAWEESFLFPSTLPPQDEKAIGIHFSNMHYFSN